MSRAGHVGEQRLGPEQREIDAQRGEGAVGEIEHAPRRRGERGRAQVERAVDAAIAIGRRARHRESRRGEPLRLALRDRARRDATGQRIAARGLREREIGDARAAGLHLRAPVPAAPPPLPRHQHHRGPGAAEQAGDDAAARRDQPRVEIEHVAIGLGIEPHRQPIARAGPRGEADHRTAARGIGMADETDEAAWSRDAGLEPEAQVDAAEMDRIIGQDRARAAGRPQSGQARHDDEIGRQPIDMEAVGEPAARPPVERHRGRLEEHALRIGEAEIADARVAPDRSVDPADMDAQAAARLELADPVGDEAVAGIAVDRHADQPEHEQQQDQHAADRPQHAAARARRDDGSGRLVGHQNA